MPLLILVLVIIAFLVGQGSVDEPSPEYRVIKGPTKTVTETVRVPTDMPGSCREAAELLPRLQEATEQLDVYAGRLGDIALAIGTFADQPGGQAEINDRMQEARDLQGKTAIVGMEVLEAQTKYNAVAERCDADLKE